MIKAIINMGRAFARLGKCIGCAFVTFGREMACAFKGCNGTDGACCVKSSCCKGDSCCK